MRALSLLLPILLAGCSVGAAVETVDAPQLKTLIDSGQAVVVDVREPDEYAEKHIDGAILAPLSSFDCSKLAAPQSKEIILQCRSGRRSAQAIEMCRKQGRSDIKRHLAGGLNAWEAAGLPVVKP